MPSSTENRKFDPFLAAIVRLKQRIEDENGVDYRIVGTGFLVSSKHVLTCAHVINEVLGKAPEAIERPNSQESIYLDFPYPINLSNGLQQASLVYWLPPKQEVAVGIANYPGAFDVAGLELHQPVDSKERSYLQLSTKDSLELSEHCFKTFGFPQHYDDGLNAKGDISGIDASGLLQMVVPKTAVQLVAKGFSGAPVYSPDDNTVIGMVVQKKDRNEHISRAIPSRALLEVWDALELYQRPANPYKGLASFREEDKQNFFGREKFIKQLYKAVHQKPLLALVGNSGSGKSSVVFAGLVPKLREEEWLIISFRPQNEPFKKLANAIVDELEVKLNNREKLIEASRYAENFQKDKLKVVDVVDNIVSKQDKPLILIIDQFEELFALTLNRDLQHNFLNHLVEATQKGLKNFRLLLTMRSDFVSHALEHAEFGQALSQATLMFTAMSREELFEVIEKPAARQRVSLEKGLTEAILNDVLTSKATKDFSGRLPLLEFSLAQLWEKQAKFTLTHEAYQAIGKVEGALIHHAERIFNNFSSEKQIRLKHIFTQLVRPGEGTEDARQISTKEQIGERNWTLVTELANERLVTTDQVKYGKAETAEVIHEALISNWPRLKEWIDADRDFLIWQNRLRFMVIEWQRHSQDKDMLLRSGQLTRAKKYLKSHKEQIDKRTKDFIEASNKQQLAEENSKRRRKRNRFLEIATFVIASLILVGIAYFLIEISRNQIIKELILQVQKIIEEPKTIKNHAEVAALLSVQSTKIKKNHETSSLVLGTLQSFPHLSNTFHGHSDKVLSVAFSPDGSKIVSGSSDGTIRLWEAKTGLAIGEPWQGHNAAVFSVAFSPDGTKVASSSEDSTIRLWEAETGMLIGEPWQGPSQKVSSVAFSPDGKQVVSGDHDNTVRLWDVESGIAVGKPWQGHSGPILSVDFSPDGTKVVSSSKDKTVRLWNVKTGTPIGESWQGHNDMIFKVAFSPDGTKVASGGNDASIRLWDVKTSKLIGKPWQHEVDSGITVGVESLAFSPDGNLVVSGGWGGTIRLWDSKTAKTIGESWKGHEDDVYSIAFSPDGTQVVSGSYDGTIRLWNVKTGRVVEEANSHSDKDLYSTEPAINKSPLISVENKTINLWDVNIALVAGQPDRDDIISIAFSPDGTKIASGSIDSTVRLWDAETGKAIGKPWKGHSGIIYKVSFSPDGTKVVSGSRDKTIHLWDVETGTSIGKSWQGHSAAVYNLAFSPDGTKVVSGSEDKTIRLWDVKTGIPIGEPWQGHSNVIYTVAFSPDGTKVVSGSYDRTLRLWDMKTGAPIGEPWRGHSDEIHTVAFSPDGTKVISGSVDNTLRLWDVKTGTSIGGPWQGSAIDVSSVAFSPDGARVISGLISISFILQPTININALSSLKLWDVKTGTPIGKAWELNNAGIFSVAFSPNGKKVVSGNADNPNNPWSEAITIWDVDENSWLERLCSIAGRNLTRGEWQKYLGNRPYEKTCPQYPAATQ